MEAPKPNKREQVALPPKLDGASIAPEKKPEDSRSKYLEKGAERRKAITGRISNFFSGFNDKVAKGANFVLGSPEMVADKATEIYGKARERATGAHGKLSDTFQRGKQGTTERLQTTKDKAIRWGLGVAASVEDRVVSAWNAPQAFILEQQARLAGNKAERSKALGARMDSKYDAKIIELEAQLGLPRELKAAEGSAHRESMEGARDKMRVLLLDARDRRGRVGHCREALLGLEKKPAKA